MRDMSIVVVGGGSGLGALLARMAAERSARAVAVIDINAEAAEAALEPVRAAGRTAVRAVGDICHGHSARAAFASVAEQLGRVDTLVNCAAIYPRKPLLEITDDEWDASNALNVKGSYHMMVASVRHMRKQLPEQYIRGRIVNISSVDAFKAHPQNAHYAATKAAIVSLTKSFAHEVAPEGILVNSVAPAGMATEKARAAGFLEELARANPLGRGATPHEIAEWVLMVGGPKNTYMTGENVIVSGGYVYA